MSNSSTDILTAALGLPEGERLEIAHHLFASVPPPKTISADDPSFAEELKRRLDYRDEDLIDYDEAMRRIRASLADNVSQSETS